MKLNTNSGDYVLGGLVEFNLNGNEGFVKLGFLGIGSLAELRLNANSGGLALAGW